MLKSVQTTCIYVFTISFKIFFDFLSDMKRLPFLSVGSDHPSNDGQRHCEQLKNSITPGLIGAYIPQCDDNGNFKPLQCWGSVGSCWCANVFTGKPVTKKTRGIKSEFCGNYKNRFSIYKLAS